MTVELDHVFIGCSDGAPEAERLLRLGLEEGSPNAHPGQGTACRRFFFRNAYLELIWISDPEQARSEPARRLGLWERCAPRSEQVCPFGVGVRPAAASDARAPFRSWSYHAPYLPPERSFQIARDPGLDEPLLFYFDWARAPSSAESTLAPGTGIRQVRFGGPRPPRSEAARSLEAIGLVAFERTPDWVVTLSCQQGAGGESDLRPDLPLVLLGC